MVKAKGLGAGLDALLGSGSDITGGDRLTRVAITDIIPGRYQPRTQIDNESLQELAESIRAQGIIQPVIVREMGLQQYELIAGERRWRAAQLAELQEIPVVVKSISDEAALAMGLIENIQRQNLNPIEEAQGLKRLVDEFGLTHDTIAKAVGRSRSSISNTLRLLNLPQPVQDLMYSRQLEMGHARALLTLPVIQQIDLAQKAAQNGWSVREVERRSQQAQTKPETTATRHPAEKSSEIQQIEAELEQRFAVPVQIQSKNQRSGRIILQFDNPETLSHILQTLGLE
ncbi:MAG: ParB/RepB/Spo0J family partition protein [Snodgrassella sp.]|uniref:ParB/RepB/Spo0J family partition protein n=1 Tax=Snodgrassella sp. TaxID=2815304 RepID=UPI00258E1D3E|nr:ParB/RepB/Spo0J family partition protein [Snodgrassella sp.]MCO6523172.1 ParB/RepB/Spo0J family partition protein [Snodgrassella sp.]